MVLGSPVYEGQKAALKQAQDALLVFLLTPAVRSFLDATDPRSVRQAIDAVNAARIATGDDPLEVL